MITVTIPTAFSTVELDVRKNAQLLALLAKRVELYDKIIEIDKELSLCVKREVSTQ